jgi:hypothetical protein
MEMVKLYLEEGQTMNIGCYRGQGGRGCDIWVIGLLVVYIAITSIYVHCTKYCLYKHSSDDMFVPERKRLI